MSHSEHKHNNSEVMQLLSKIKSSLKNKVDGRTEQSGLGTASFHIFHSEHSLTAYAYVNFEIDKSQIVVKILPKEKDIVVYEVPYKGRSVKKKIYKKNPKSIRKGPLLNGQAVRKSYMHPDILHKVYHKKGHLFNEEDFVVIKNSKNNK